MSNLAPDVLTGKAGISSNLDAIAFLPNGSPSSEPVIVETSPGAGESTYTGPSYFVAAWDGDYAATFEGDFYNRIHVLPSTFVLGNVLQTAVRTFEVWNAHFTSKTLSAIDEIGTEGIVLTGGPGDPPTVYGPLRSAVYTATVGLDGPLSINASYEFDFAAANNVLVVLTGARAVIFAFEPQLPITERLEWLTDLQESYGGAEQRIMVRHKPRQAMDANYLLANPTEVARALNTLYGRVGGTIAVPVWWDLRPLLADVSIGGTTVSVSTANADFREGGFAILWRASDDFEVVEISTLSPTQLNLVRPVELAHPAVTTAVVPLLRALAPDPLPTSRYGNGVTTFDIAWQFTEVVDLAALDGELTLYRGLPVLNDLNFMSGAQIDEPIQSKAVLIDNKTTAGAKSYRRRFPRIVTVKGWAPETAADIWTVRKLLHALRGRQRSFWLPSFRKDFTLTATVADTATTLLVSPAEYERFVDVQEPLGDIAIYLKNGTVFFREITNVEPGSGGTEQLTINSPLGATVNPDDVLRISYLMRARLDTDSIEITHLGLDRAVVNVPVVGVIQ